MVTSGPNLNTSSPTKRPFGILIAEWYFVTLTVVISARVIANLDFYIRNASRLDLHFFSVLRGYGGDFRTNRLRARCFRRRWASANAALGTMARHRFGGRWRSLCDSVLFCSFVFWAVDVSSASRMAKRKEHDTTWIRNLHCLLSVAAQDQARVPTAPTFSAGQSEPNL